MNKNMLSFDLSAIFPHGAEAEPICCIIWCIGVSICVVTIKKRNCSIIIIMGYSYDVSPSYTFEYEQA